MPGPGAHESGPARNDAGHHRGEAGAKLVRDSIVAKVPLKVASSAEDIAELVCFLATSKSSNMTGELVRMDAGMHLIT